MATAAAVSTSSQSEKAMEAASGGVMGVGGGCLISLILWYSKMDASSGECRRDETFNDTTLICFRVSDV